mgnify:CR=1 FL=1
MSSERDLRCLLVCLHVVAGAVVPSTDPIEVNVRQSQCFEYFGVTKGAPGELFPFGDKTATSFLQQKVSIAEWPDPVTEQCKQSFDATSCGMVGSFAALYSPPTYSILKTTSSNDRDLYAKTQQWLRGEAAGYQPTLSTCTWCESTGTGHGVCMNCDAEDINNMEMQGFSCAPHCVSSLKDPAPVWQPRTKSPWFPVPPQHVQTSSHGMSEAQWCKVLAQKVGVCVCLTQRVSLTDQCFRFKHKTRMGANFLLVIYSILSAIVYSSGLMANSIYLSQYLSVMTRIHCVY